MLGANGRASVDGKGAAGLSTVEEEIKTARLQQLALSNAKAAAEAAAQSGRYVRAADARQEMGRAAARLMAVFEASFSEFANAVMASPPATSRDALRTPAEPKADPKAGGPNSGWAELLSNIANGVNYHSSIASLAMMLLRAGMVDGAAVKVLRAVMEASGAGHDQRWQSRYDDIRRAVRTAREKIGEKSEPPKPASVVLNAERLNQMTFGPIKFVVPGYIVEGLTLFGGKPKAGKSWLLLHVAFAVAEGGFTLGNVQCEQGDVLCCALEDNPRRLQSRLTKLFGTSNWPAKLDFVCEMQRLAEGGLDFIKSWIEKAERPRLVIIDTLAMVRMPKRGDQSPYEADYAAVKELRDLALKYGVAIVLVHHLRKAEADDVFDTISGTLGLSGAPDTVMIIQRNNSGTTLHAKGRDLIEIEKAIKFDPGTCTWVVLGEAGAIRKSTERGVIVDALGEAGAGPLTPNQIAAACGMKAANVRKILAKLLAEGVIKKASYGKYVLSTPATRVTEEAESDRKGQE
jgi:predicted transcriptional regulator